MKSIFLGLLSFILLFFSFLPLNTQDGANHKQVAVLFERLNQNPAELFVYQKNLHLITTNVAFSVLYAPIARWVPVDIYEKGFVIFSLVLLVFAYRVFLRVWAPEQQSFWWVVAFACFNALFLKGMYNFLLSVPLTLFALAFFRKGIVEYRTSWKIAWGLLYLLFVWLAFQAHPFSAILLVVVQGAALVFDASLSKKSQIIPDLFPLLLLAVGFVWPLLQHSSGGKLPLHFAPTPLLFAGGWLLFFWTAKNIQFIFTLPAFLLLGFIGYQSLRTVAWRHKIYWVVCLLLYFLFPKGAAGGSHIDERFLIYVLCFLPLGLQVASEKFWRWGLASFLLLAASTGWGMTVLNHDLKDVRAVLEALPSGSRLYPINFKLSAGSAVNNDLMHAWAHYGYEKTVFSPYLFVFLDPCAVIRKHPASQTYFPAYDEKFPSQIRGRSFCTKGAYLESLDCDAVTHQEYQKLLDAGSYYNYWLVIDPPQEFEQRLAGVKGLEKIVAQGSATLWHLAGSKDFSPALFEKAASRE